MQQQIIVGLTGNPQVTHCKQQQNNQKGGKQSQDEDACSSHKGCGEKPSIPVHPGPPQAMMGAGRTAPFVKGHSSFLPKEGLELGERPLWPSFVKKILCRGGNFVFESFSL